MLKIIPVQNSVGMVLCHDITQIIPGQFKGPAFKKGHVIQPEDIPKLLDLGKENIYVLDLERDSIHEDAAAIRIAQAAIGKGIKLTAPSEGRVNMLAALDGLLKVNVDTLRRINSIEDIVLTTLHSNQRVTAGRTVAGTRIIPLVVKEEKIKKVEEHCGGNTPVLEVKPFRAFKVGIVTTGSEVYHGRIQDQFGPVLRAKFAELGSFVIRQVMVSDIVPMTVKAIHDLVQEGAEMVAVTGGMSVDPDDQTPASIRATGARVITYGVPTFPGAMFMLAYLGEIPILGLPGCVMYQKATIFDLIVPRLLAGEKVSREDIISLGHGGLCSNCPDCRFPVCGFGKQ